MLNEPDEPLLSALKQIVGEAGWLAPDEAHLVEQRSLFRGNAAIVLRPSETGQVSEIVKLCADAHVGIVPWGGGTGLVGGQVKPDPPTPVLLSLERMRAVRSISPDQNTLTVEAGLPLQRAQELADAADRLFPLSYASEGTASIGGAVAVNSGGLQALRYGVARDLCLGLEVVTADGEIWNGLTTLRKDNTGYDLRDLYIGSEGTLGVITAAVLRLYPKPRAKATAWISLDDPATAVTLLNAIQEASGGAVAMFELMSRRSIEFGLDHQPDARLPVSEPAPWYVLTELWGGEQSVLDGPLETVLGEFLENSEVRDAAIAANEAQRAAFRTLREGLSDAQKPQGGSIKHDVSLPVASIPDFLVSADAAVEAAIPGARPCAFGHLGDGNIHYNVSQPVQMEREAFLARWDEINHRVHDLVAEMGGSISAEHGIGRLKRVSLKHYADPVKLDLMRRIKHTLDPLGIMNPGAVL